MADLRVMMLKLSRFDLKALLLHANAANPVRAVTLPNIGVPKYMGVPHRVTYP